MADLNQTSQIRSAFGQLMKQEVLEEYQTASITIHRNNLPQIKNTKFEDRRAFILHILAKYQFIL